MKQQPTEQYKTVLVLPETVDFSLFNSRHYVFSVSNGLYSSRVPPIVCSLDTGASQNRTNAYFLEPNCLNNIYQRNKQKMQCFSNPS